MHPLRLKGNIVLPNTVLENAVLEVQDGKISQLYDADNAPTHVEHDYRGCYLFPGLIDAHVHAYSSNVNEQEGIEKLTRGAARGGITTIIDMPYDRPQAVTTRELVEAKIEKVEQESIVEVALFGTCKKYGGEREIAGMSQAGVCAFKFSTYETDPERFPEVPDSELIKIFKELAKIGKVALFHAENGAIIDPLIAEMKHLGEAHPEAHCWSRPLVSETTSVLKLLELARTYPVKLHIVHLSAPMGYDAVNWYKQYGVDITTETCIQYLLLNEAALKKNRALAKCNPPVRDETTRLELWKRLQKGEIDFITSDHAPWPIGNKQHKNIFDNASGLPGVDVLFPLLFSEAVIKRLMSADMVGRLLAYNPAKRYGLNHRKGSLEIGKDADITIIDPKQSHAINASKSESISKWSPYDGWELQGKILATFVRGQEVYANGNIQQEKGYGQFIAGK